MLNDWVNKDESLSKDKAQNKDNKLAGFRISSLKIYKLLVWSFKIYKFPGLDIGESYYSGGWICTFRSAFVIIVLRISKYGDVSKTRLSRLIALG